MRAEEKITIVNGRKRRHRVEVFALGPNDTILTAYRQGSDHPELPGGGIDNNESATIAAMRELDEESGWTGFNFIKLELDRDYVFKGEDDIWFNSGAWKEEENIAVICRLDKFAPSTRFASEGDHLDFKPLPISDVVKAAEQSATQNQSLRKQMLNIFRLAVFRQLANSSIKKPAWATW